jgi:hypothetical protein
VTTGLCEAQRLREQADTSGSDEEYELRSKDIPWLRVFVEGAVIVGSILLAFALDAWWDNREREDELRDQRAVVAREMQAAREALQRVLDAHDMNARLAQHLASTLGRVAEGSEVVVSDTLIGPLFPQVTADVTTGSLDAFIAAGGLEVVEDVETRRRLLDWPTRIQDLLDDEIYLRNFAAVDLASYLRSNYAVANAELRSIPWLMGRFGKGPQVDPDLLGTVTLRRDPQLMNLLAARESGERGMRYGLVEMLDQAARIVEVLEDLE